MRRVPDWPERLAAYVETTRAQTFAWGRQDCCTWACGALVSITGADPMERLRGTYDGRREGVVLLRRHGGLPRLTERLAAAAGYERVPPQKAGRGDLVLARNFGKTLLGIVFGPVLAAGGSGLVGLPRDEIIRAWRV